jgi:hypothetical protein
LFKSKQNKQTSSGMTITDFTNDIAFSSEQLTRDNYEKMIIITHERKELLPKDMTGLILLPYGAVTDFPSM